MRNRNLKLNQRRNRRVPPSSRRVSSRLRPSALMVAGRELVAFHELFAEHFDRIEQRCWSAFYLSGQLSNVERKTIEPMVLALRGVEPETIRAVQQFIGQSRWAPLPLIVQLEALVADWLGEPDGVVIVDGSGFPKRGAHSAGVARQYCGRLGKVENCQEGVFAVYASSRGHAFLNGQLYLPEKWLEPAYAEHRMRCGIPPHTTFQTEPQIAVGLIRQLVEHARVPFRWVTADEEFGRNPGFLDSLAMLQKWYLAEVPANTRVWLRTPHVQAPGQGLLGRPRVYPRVWRSAPLPRSVQEVAASLSASAWKRRLIKEGGKGPMWAEFAWLRVTTIRDKLPGPRVWLLLQRSVGPRPEIKYYLSNAPASCPSTELVRLTGYRWPIETAFEEAKGEVGMAHYETRSWQGWHHHMVQSFMAHLFLVRLQHVLQKKSGHYHQSDAGHHRSCDRQRASRRSRHARLRSLSSEAKSQRLSFTPQAHALSIAV